MSGLSGTAKGKDSVVQLVSLENNRSKLISAKLGDHQAGSIGLGLSKNVRGQRLAVVALTFNDEAAVLDLDTKQVVANVKIGIAPFGAVVSHDSAVAYVSNWGSRFPKSGERTAATGPEATADRRLLMSTVLSQAEQ